MGFQRQKQSVVVSGYLYVRSTNTFGRAYECFYLRLLEIILRGPTTFEALRAVNGIILPTYRTACS